MIGNSWDNKLEIIWKSEGFKKFLNIIKKDEIISIAERRKLEQFPSVSISQIINGTFFNKFDNISLYYM